MKRKTLAVTIFIGLITWSCASNSEKRGHIGMINFPESLNQIGVIPLSTVASGIEYIPLETSDESLVGTIGHQVFLDNGLIYIKDNTGLIKIFDLKGNFVRKIDRVGRGPQEYLQSSILSLSPSNGNILLTGNGEIKEYNSLGRFIRRVEIPKMDEYRTFSSLMFSENRFVAPLFKTKYEREYCAVIYDSLANIQQMIPTPELYGTEQQQTTNQNDGEVVRFMPVIEAKVFRYGDMVRIFYPETTEIFTTNGYGNLDTVYVINYGEYRLPGGVVNDYTERGKYISPHNFIESKNHLFINASLRNVMEDSPLFTGYFVFNKRINETRLLLDNQKKRNGFTDDMMGGPQFWPKTISGERILISFAYSEALIEHAENNEVSDKLKNILSNLRDDSNPVVILVHLK